MHYAVSGKQSEVHIIGGGAYMENGKIIEERLNAFTHSVGTGLAIAALPVLMIQAADHGGRLYPAAFLIYGISQILLYLSSALTHLFVDMPGIHRRLRVVDQISVYLLIAGTYTPITLIAMRDHGGNTLFLLIWGLAFLGILSKLFLFRRKNIFSDLLYIPMGWMILFFLPAAIELFPRGLLYSILTGGAFYTFGVLFYLSKKIPCAHVLWHLFVLAGSITFFRSFVIHLF